MEVGKRGEEKGKIFSLSLSLPVALFFALVPAFAH